VKFSEKILDARLRDTADGSQQAACAISSHLFMLYLHPRRARGRAMKHDCVVPEMALRENEFSGFRNLRSRCAPPRSTAGDRDCGARHVVST